MSVLLGLQLYKLPEFQLVFSVRNFAMAPHQLYDSGPVPLQRCVCILVCLLLTLTLSSL